MKSPLLYRAPRPESGRDACEKFRMAPQTQKSSERRAGLRWQAVFGCQIIWNRSTPRARARVGRRICAHADDARPAISLEPLGRPFGFSDWPADSLAIHAPPLPAQHYPDSEVPKPRPRMGKLSDPEPERGLSRARLRRYHAARPNWASRQARAQLTWNVA
jgi:hypothetical protein